MKGNHNATGRKKFKWRVGAWVQKGAELRGERAARLKAEGLEWDWSSGEYVGISTMFDHRALAWIDVMRNAGYKVRYFTRRPKKKDIAP